MMQSRTMSMMMETQAHNTLMHWFKMGQCVAKELEQ
jgi:hypothetical protein